MTYEEQFIRDMARELRVKKNARAPILKNYSAGRISRLTTDMVTTSRSADGELRDVLVRIRARSRELAMDNDYAKKFIHMCDVNIVGPAGIALQNKAKKVNGNLDKRANDSIEEAWRRWCKKENASVTGQLSFTQIQRLVMKSVVRDGEILIRKVKYPNEFRFALQIIEADHLDENLNKVLPNGNRIRMGVEFNRWWRPVAYHLLVSHPGDYQYHASPRRHERIPASEIIHVFVMDRARQSRGVPWMYTAVRRLHDIGGYEESEIIGARASASKMGIIKTPTGTEYKGEGKDTKGNVLSDFEPGVFEQLPEGWDIELLDPKHPSGNFDPFLKAMLRGVSSGLNVSYCSLASDLGGVNYSSIRAGTIEERDNWRLLQTWFIETFVGDVFVEWLEMSLLSDALPLQFTQFDKFNKPTWKVRGWQWVDPLKEVKANIEAIRAGLTSRTHIAAESGRDIEEIYEELAAEKALAKQYDLNFESAASAGGQETIDEVEEPEEAPAGGNGKGG